MRRSLTQGDVFTILLRFSLPFLLTNLLQALYGACDLLIVGRFADAAGVAAVATGGQVMQTITGLAIGLTTGGTVVVAQKFGGGHRRETSDAAATVLLVFTALSLAMTLIALSMTGPICFVMRVPPEAIGYAREYLAICALGIVPIVGYNALSGILRGLGDSQTPFLFMIAACAANIFGDLFLVGKLKMGAKGAAIATVTAQGTCLLLMIVFLIYKGMASCFCQSRPRFKCLAAKSILNVGLPIALQEALVNVSFLIITAILNAMGLAASAAVGVTEKLIVFSMLPTTAFAAAVAAMTAQNQGAGMMERARECLRTGIFLSLLFGAACFLCAQVNAPGLIALFCPDPAVIRAGTGYLRAYSFDCVAVCFVFCINAYLSGSGHALFPLVHSVAATCLVRLPLSWLLSRAPDASMVKIGCAAPAATLLSLALCFIYLRRLDRKAVLCRHSLKLGVFSGNQIV